MKVTSEMLQRFVGGQLEIQNPSEGYYYRGEIRAITITRAEDTLIEELVVNLKWNARGDGFPPTTFTSDDNLDYSTSLELYRVSDIGPGSEGDSRIFFQFAVTGEIVVLFPPNGNKLDPAHVRPALPASTGF